MQTVIDGKKMYHDNQKRKEEDIKASAVHGIKNVGFKNGWKNTYTLNAGDKVAAYFIDGKTVYSLGTGVLRLDPMAYIRMLKRQGWGILDFHCATSSSYACRIYAQRYACRIYAQRRGINISRFQDYGYKANVIRLDSGEKVDVYNIEFCPQEAAEEMFKLLIGKFHKTMVEIPYSAVKYKLKRKFDLILDDSKKHKQHLMHYGYTRPFTLKELRRWLNK